MGEKDASKLGGGKFIDAMYVHISHLTRGTYEALSNIFGPLTKSRRTPTPINYGNCPEGYNLEKVGEDDEYIMTLCSGGHHALLLAKKTHKHEASNGGFAKDNTVAEIIGGSKYER